MKIKISATFWGKCSICGKKTIVFTVGDEDTKKAVTLCKECSIRLNGTPVSEIVKKFGKVRKDVFRPGIKIEKKMKTG